MTPRHVYGSSRFNAPGTFLGIGFSSDSKTLVALMPGEGSSRCVSFNMEDGAVASQQEIKGTWRDIRVLPGGDLIVSTWGKVQRVSTSGKTVWTVKGEQALHLAAVSLDGALLATVEDETAQIREAKKGTVVHTLKEKEGDIYGIAFSAEGGLLATGSSKGMVRLYDARSGKEQAKRKGTKTLTLAFSSNGEQLLVGHGAGKIELLQVEGLKPLSPILGHHEFPEGGDAGCRWVGFSPDGKSAYSLGNERRLRSWRVPDGEEGWVIEVPWRHAQGAVTALSPDGRWIATGSTAGALSVWSAEDGKPVVRNAAPTRLEGLALTPQAVLAASGRTYVSWDRKTGEITEILSGFPPTDVKALESGLLVRLDYENIFVGEKLDPDAASAFALSTYASGPLALSRGGALLAAPAQENVEVWDLKRSSRIAALLHDNSARACAFGPKDAWLVTADTNLHIWRLGEEPELIRDIPLAFESEEGDMHVRGLAVSERGWIAVSVDGTDNNNDAQCSVVLADPRSGKLVAQLKRPGVRLGQVAFVGAALIAVPDSSGQLLLADVSNPAKPRWLKPQEAEDVWPESEKGKELPLAVLGSDVAYVGPDGNVVVKTLADVKPETEAPFLLGVEGSEGAGAQPAAAKAEALFEKRLAGTRFLFVGRFKETSADFRELTVKELGGEVATKPDAKVTHLVLGEKPSAKVESDLKAKGAKYKPFTEKALMKLLLPTAAEARALLRSEVKDGAKRWNAWRERYVEARGEDFPTPLQGIELEGLDLRKYKLAVLDFTGAKLAGANFAGVDLFDTIFRNANLSGVDFSKGKCFRTVFTGANLSKARFGGVELSSARFDGADLREADFRDAKLIYADFSGADLRGALLPKKLPDNMKHNAKTRWPDGVRPPG
ncbi:pentapeptide repeat-containing protein [Hyalangium versicolor]|uniref:pentapeptide repeat-containing protein n=1 Tax=Hyalangium versicolor TaxID=2861190 RepID=UPI001CCF6E84|nr:pentapeptide repeat-containing protein [Hyalangium versicolor]